MRISGIEKSTLIDYPGKIAATIFTAGCNFRCPFCYNPELVIPERIGELLPEKEVFNFLKDRKGFLNGVVICGGEPTVQPDLKEFAEEIKKMGFAIKLDTNGSNPEILENIIALFDYIAMDVKAPKERYEQVVGVEVDIPKIQRSIDLIKTKAKDYEFRTTMVPDLVKKEDILKIADWIKPAKKYFLQNFSNKQETIDKSFVLKKPFSDQYLEKTKKQVESFFDVCRIR